MTKLSTDAFMASRTLHDTSLGPFGHLGLACASRAEVDRLTEAMLVWELRSYREARANAGPVLFDRGLPDLAGYLSLSGLPVPSHIREATRKLRYNRLVFIAPPWPEIFRQDAERKQSMEEAQETYAAMVNAYSELGYDLCSLPRTPVDDRVEFVLARITYVIR